MKQFYLKKRFLFLLLLATLLPSTTYGKDGDTFTSKTIDGIELTFKIISESKKTCKVADCDTSESGQVTIPEEVNGYSVTSIGVSAFYGCSRLTSVNIPNSVTSIGEYAFQNCSGLTSVNIPNSVTSIGGSAFYGCSGLTSVNIPNSVTSIGDYAFSGCSGLRSSVHNSTFFIRLPMSYDGEFSIPDGIQKISGGAFTGCSGLTAVIIPNSVTSIGDYAFGKCI